MESLLFLAHRLPFPPNKGDKVRSFHFFRHLAGRYRVFLGTFVDDPADWEHIESVRGLCAGMHVEALTPWTKRCAERRGLADRRGDDAALFPQRAASTDGSTEVAARERVTRAFAFSSPMAQYTLDLPQVRSFVDFVDMDSAKWGEYARRRPWPISALYRQGGRATPCAASGTSPRAPRRASSSPAEEADLFCAAAPECAKPRRRDRQRRRQRVFLAGARFRIAIRRRASARSSSPERWTIGRMWTRCCGLRARCCPRIRRARCDRRGSTSSA